MVQLLRFKRNEGQPSGLTEDERNGEKTVEEDIEKYVSGCNVVTVQY